MGIISLIISIFSLLIAAAAFRYRIYQDRLRIKAEANQDMSRKDKWQVVLSISNSGWRPMSIVKVTLGKPEKVVHIRVKDNNNPELPLKLEQADVKQMEFNSEYMTKDTPIYIYDHKGKRHKTKVRGLPSLFDE